VGEGPYFLGDSAPVGGGGQLAEHREQPEVDALARRQADQPLRSAALPTPLNSPGLSRCPISTTGLGGGRPCTTSANRTGEQNAATIRVSRREPHRNQRPVPTSSRAPAFARPGSDSAGRPGAQRRCTGHLRTTHPVDAAGDRRCRRNRRGGPSVPAEEMIAPQPHTGGLSALNPKPWAGHWTGSPRTSRPGRPALSARHRQGPGQRAGVTKCLPG